MWTKLRFFSKKSEHWLRMKKFDGMKLHFSLENAVSLSFFPSSQSTVSQTAVRLETQRHTSLRLFTPSFCVERKSKRWNCVKSTKLFCPHCFKGFKFAVLKLFFEYFVTFFCWFCKTLFNAFMKALSIINFALKKQFFAI